jgi:signal peptidase I
MDQSRTPRQHGLLFHVLDVIFNIVVIVAIVAGIRTFLVSPFQVEGSSMSATLEDHEYIIINKLAYFVGKPERGDIVVFRPPNDPNKYYVKRVIGVPGDTVTLQDGHVYVQEGSQGEPQKLEELYLDERNAGQTFPEPTASAETAPVSYTVPADKYFLLGDNRKGSHDSRMFRDAEGNPVPFVARAEIKGRVWLIALPITKIHAFEQPDYHL